MTSINPYLNFPGNAEEAFNFYKSVFGADFMVVQRFKDMPGSDQIPAAFQEKILHIALPISKDHVLMASDVVENMGPPHVPGNNVAITVNVDSEHEARRIFDALSKDGDVIMPLEKAFWGAYFGQFTDRFGIQWMVNYDFNRKQQS